MPGILAGDSNFVTPTTVASTLGALARWSRVKVKARNVTLYTPDGSDGTNGPAANTDVVWVGPNKTTGFPLGPGKAVTIWNVNPYDIGVTSPSASQKLYFVFGGDDATDSP